MGKVNLDCNLKLNYDWRNTRLKYYVLILISLISFQFCHVENKPTPIYWEQFRSMVDSHDIEKIVIVNREKAMVFIKADRLSSPEYKNLSGTSKIGPQFYYNIGDLKTFEDRLANIQKDFPENEIISPNYETRQDFYGDMLSYLFPLSIILLIIVPFVIWLLLLINILKSEFKNPIDKLIWIIIITFIPLIGFILYWFIGKKQRIN